MTLATVGSVLLLGCGKMGGAMLDGWLAGGLPAGRVTVADPGPPDEIADLIGRHELHHVTDAGVAAPADIVIAAVKPQMMDQALPSAARAIAPGGMVLSVAAGKSVADLARHLPAGTPVIRAMPNTPAAVGKGITACFAGPGITARHKADATDLLDAVGEVVWVADETLMDAVTAVSGSGPAYVFLLAETLAAAGRQAGLPSDIADRLARATVIGAGALLDGSDLDAAQLRRNVTSPNGTTAAALDVLMADDGLEPLLKRAVAAAKRRSEELSG